MLRRKLLGHRKIFMLYIAIIAFVAIADKNADKNHVKKPSKYKLTNVLSALAPEKGSAKVVSTPTSSAHGTKKASDESKKTDILANAMTQLQSDGQPQEVSEPPREYDLAAQRRMENPGEPRVINLPGMINVFGPPPKRGFQQPHHDPLHVLQLPGLSRRNGHDNYELVSPHFNSENIPVHFYPHVRAPEVTGGKPRHLFLPYPKDYGLGPHAGGLHGGMHGDFPGGLVGGLGGGLGGGFGHGLHGAGTDGFGVAGLTPFHDSGIDHTVSDMHLSGYTPFAPIADDHLPEHLPDQVQDYHDHDAGRVDIVGHEMGRFVKMPGPQIMIHPPKHVFEPGKELTLDNGHEFHMNNVMHVVQHGHHHRHHHHDDDDDDYGHDDHFSHDDHYDHEHDLHDDHDVEHDDHDIVHDDHDIVHDDHGDRVVIAPDDGDQYDSHGSPVTIAEPENIVHEHHSVEHHHHWSECRLISLFPFFPCAFWL